MTTKLEGIKDFLKEQVPIVIITLLILVFVIYYFVPKVKEYLQLRKDILSQNQKIDKLTLKLNDLMSLDKTELQNNLTLLVRAVPVAKDFYPQVKNIKNIVNEEGLYLKEFQFTLGEISTESAKNKSKDNNGSASFPYQVAISGPLENIEKVFSRIEKVVPLVSISSIKLSLENSTVSSESAGPPIYTGQFSLMGYYSYLPAKSGSSEDPLPKLSSSQNQIIGKLLQYEYFLGSEESFEDETIIGKQNPFPFN